MAIPKAFETCGSCRNPAPREAIRSRFLFYRLRSTRHKRQFSPDGQWIAYASNESGLFEVYVRSFPSGAGKAKISIGGGRYPRCRKDGKELFYLAPDRKLMAVAVNATPGPRPVFEAAAPEELFDMPGSD